jgi:hypothetical protein
MGIDTCLKHKPDYPIDRRSRHHSYPSGFILPVSQKNTGNDSTDENNSMTGH